MKVEVVVTPSGGRVVVYRGKIYVPRRPRRRSVAYVAGIGGRALTSYAVLLASTAVLFLALPAAAVVLAPMMMFYAFAMTRRARARVKEELAKTMPEDVVLKLAAEAVEACASSGAEEAVVKANGVEATVKCPIATVCEIYSSGTRKVIAASSAAAVVGLLLTLAGFYPFALAFFAVAAASRLVPRRCERHVAVPLVSPPDAEEAKRILLGQ